MDVDGTLIPTLHDNSRVVRNISAHIQKTLGVQHARAEALNADLYKNFGHTWLGLKTRYPERYSLSLEEFNADVYNAYAMDTEIHVSDSHMMDLQRLLMNGKFYEVYMCTFSNAPKIWCDKVLWALGVLDSLPVFELTDTVKPEISAYERVTQHVTHHDRRIEELYFIDDSLTNLEVVMVPNNGWIPILYGHDSQKFMQQGGMCVRSIAELNTFLW